MFKKFISAFLGSMAAIWLSIILLALAVLVFVAIVVGKSVSPSTLVDHSILKISLSGDIAEREQPVDLKTLALNGIDDEGATLENILAAVRTAKSDSKIDGIVLDCKGSSLGYASRQELIQALSDFKATGKWIYAYGDTYTQGDYYVATTATRMFLNPVGAVSVTGIGVSIPFYKNALDKLGVEVQVFKVGTFKSAVEPYLLTSISEPSKLQTQVFIDDIWSDVKATIAKNRAVPVDSVQAWATGMIGTQRAETCVTRHVVDELAYGFEFEKKLKKLTECDEDDDLNFVTPADYIAVKNVSSISGTPMGQPHVAVLYASGDIVDEGESGISSQRMVPQILDLAEDENVKGLVLRVNSGGGSAFASEQIWRALQEFKKKGKPFYVSMGDYAASGGYYISCGADSIFADTNTLTGSIGIFGLVPCAQGLLNNHLGVNFSTVATNDNAVISMWAPMNDDQKQAQQAEVEQGYKLFTSRVAEGRKLKIEDVLEIAEGRVWDGKSAIKIHLIDRFGTLNDAVIAMAKKVGLTTDDVVNYPRVTRSAIQELILNSGVAEITARPSITIPGVEPKEIIQFLNWFDRVKSMSKVQARMEDLKVY